MISLRSVLAWLLLAAGIGGLTPAWAATLQELSLDNWRTGDGLPHNQVHAIAQTPDGYLWLATWEGLARFNGFEFRVYNADNTPAIGNPAIRALAVDHDGALWLGTTRSGLIGYRDGEWHRYSTKDGLAADHILALLVDRDNKIWIATEEHGISVFDGERFEHYGSEQLLDPTVLALAESPDGSIWVATRDGINVIRGSSPDGPIDAYGQTDGLPAAPVMDLLFANDVLYAGTEAGLYRWTGQRFVADRRWAPTNQAAVAELYATRDGTILAGTFADGVFRLVGNNAERLDTRNGLPNNRIWSMLEDREGNLWVGTSGGLSRMRATPFSSLTMRSGLSDDYVRAVLEDKLGNLWVGTSNGLTRIKGNDVAVLDETNGLPTASILSLAEVNQQLWAGTYGAGVSVIENDRVTRRITFPTLPSNHVRTLIQGSDGSAWIGTVAGLTRLRGSEAKVYTISDGLPRSYINSLLEDSTGRLWVGTSNGLAWYQDDQIVSLNDSEGYDNADVFHFWEDPGGNVWMATNTGLLRHAPGDARRFDRIGPEHGLPHPVLFSVIGDNNGRLWLSSNGGVFRTSMDALNAVASGNASHVNFERFTEDEGLPSLQANGGTQPAASITKSGRLLFATAGGVAAVDPTVVDSMLGAALVPKPVVESVLIDYRAVDLDNPPIVEPDAKRLEVRFVGLNLASPEAVRYRHRLTGYEDDWSETVSDRTAQYTNLPPGEYRFEVAAAAPLTGWSEPAGVDFRVRPQVHQMLWFRLLLLSLLAGSIWGSLRWRTASLRHKADELAREVDHRTRHLRNQTQRLLEASREKSELLQKLEDQSAAFAQQAREDALTGLNNRRHFDEIMERDFSAARRGDRSLTVALLDIDYFKQVNDKFSHQVGDEVLKLVAARISDELAPFDAESARYGGEEFVMLFRDMSVVTARELCEQIRARVNNADYSAIAPGLQVTVSIGLSDRLDVASHEKMLSLADQRLYEAKDGGRNQIRY